MLYVLKKFKIDILIKATSQKYHINKNKPKKTLRITTYITNKLIH